MAYKILNHEGKEITHKGHEVFGSETEIPESEQKAIVRDDEKRIVEVTVSSDRRDRSGDRVIQEGIDPQFAKSVLYAHDYGGSMFSSGQSALPIGKIIGRELKRKKGYKFTTEQHEFPPEGTYALSDTAWNMIKFGALNSTSIGFIPKVIDRPETDEEMEKLDVGRYGVVFREIEQLETSWVPVQANREAVLEAIGKGIIRDEEMERFFPLVWRSLEIPKHWFVGENIAPGESAGQEGLTPAIDPHETPDENMTELVKAINSLKETVEGLKVDIDLIRGLQESGDMTDLELTDVMNALDTLEEHPGLMDAFEAAVDKMVKKIPGSIENITASIVKSSLGIVDPTQLNFKSKRRF